MLRLLHLLLGAWVACCGMAGTVFASDAALFRLFLTDGTEVISYGEFARLGDQVVVSVPAGGSADQPRLHVISLNHDLVDWARTDRYTASVRYQRYAATRGEEDFERLGDQVAGVLSQIAFTTDRARALALADEARRALAEWPIANYGYRHEDVRDIVSVLDDAIAALGGRVDGGTFAFSLVATAPPVDLEPLRGAPSDADQLRSLLRLAALTSHPADRVALLHSASAMLAEPGGRFEGLNTSAMRRSISRQIRDEQAIDARYGRLADRLMHDATRAAAAARVSDIERVIDRIDREDARLGRRRPDVVQALQASVQVQLGRARELRLLRDQWELRRGLFREYQRQVGAQLRELVKMDSPLNAIRRLDGPAPQTLLTLRGRLTGGADRLDRLLVPPDLRPSHDLLVGAWRLAQQAVNGRYDAVVAGDVDAAWTASSAAAGSLMLLGRVQQSLAALSEPPTLRDVRR